MEHNIENVIDRNLVKTFYKKFGQFDIKRYNRI